MPISRIITGIQFRWLYSLLLCLGLAACSASIETDNTPELYPRPDRATAFYKHADNFLDDRLTKARSDHFTLWSNLPDPTIQLILQDLEDLRTALLIYHDISPGLPDMNIDILLVEDSAKYAQFDTGHSSVGFYSRSIIGPAIVIDASRIALDPNDFWSTLYHEYAHHFHATFLPYKTPIWMNEGLAQYSSSFRRTETGFGFGHDQPHHVDILRATRSQWLDSRRLVGELEHYPYIRGYFGEAAARRTTLFYEQSWLLAFWMRQTEVGQTAEASLIERLTNGDDVAPAFPSDLHDQLQSFMKDFSPGLDETVIDSQAFNVVTPVIEDIGVNEYLGRVGLQLASDGNIPAALGIARSEDMLNATEAHIIPYREAINGLHLLDTAQLGLAKTTLNAASTSKAADSAIIRLNAVMNILIEQHIMPNVMNGRVRMEHRKHMRQSVRRGLATRPNDVDLDILRLNLIGTNANQLSESEIDSAKQILDSGHHKRNPVMAIGLVYPLIALEEFDEADAVIARFRLWHSKMTPLESNRLDDMSLDIEASRQVFARQVE